MGDLILTASNYVSYFAQSLAIFIIVNGIIRVFWLYIQNLFKAEGVLEAIKKSRAELGYSFSVALGVLIGSSILKTVVAPNWDMIGQLASIIAIRTVLNYFLTKDIFEILKEEQNEIDSKVKKEMLEKNN
ncbi:MAG: DUF1622 domain-containing protein [Fusobacteriota bacterium]